MSVLFYVKSKVSLNTFWVFISVMRMKKFQRKMTNGSGLPHQQTLYQGCSEKLMSNSVKDLYKWSALTHLTIPIMMGFPVKALYKFATQSDLT